MFNNLRNKLVTLGTVGAASLVPVVAMAQTAPAADFDPQTVIDKVTLYGEYAVAMLAAFILVRWGLKALKII